MRFPILALLITQTIFAADVLVYGGSAAGIAAAITAARQGMKVSLVAPEQHLGGILVEGLGSADINNHWFQNDVAVGGFAAEFPRSLPLLIEPFAYAPFLFGRLTLPPFLRSL
ncbi:MAG: FAD-dependent oxidoreductase [Rhodospirillales bacterium]|nr:FAD-dependent oxidoreductase [Rhodospirillales bacterium]